MNMNISKDVKKWTLLNSSDKYKTATAVLYGCPKCLFIVVIAGLGLSLGNQRINFNMNDLNMSEWPGTVETWKWSVPNLEDWRGQVQCYPYQRAPSQRSSGSSSSCCNCLIDVFLHLRGSLGLSCLAKGTASAAPNHKQSDLWHSETPRKMQMLVCRTGGSFGGNDAKCLKHSSELVVLMGCFFTWDVRPGYTLNSAKSL